MVSLVVVLGFLVDTNLTITETTICSQIVRKILYVIHISEDIQDSEGLDTEAIESESC